jgi:hypothetical protein
MKRFEKKATALHRAQENLHALLVPFRLALQQ